ncbi:hypothetical protein CMEL01_13721 [Colletotrichum melonis]|uniref:Uncharacterized protein n=1 Tax=Colletotrichum melonis TaxID=1209925 RepID=A0AAI9UQ42_9PEZI|nr:hypothetical protein CMEL01_13721 [Colletotrichum melonis]
MHHFNAADNHPEAASRWVSWIPMAGLKWVEAPIINTPPSSITPLNLDIHQP